MGGAFRRFRLLAAVVLFWVLFCWFIYGPRPLHVLSPDQFAFDLTGSHPQDGRLHWRKRPDAHPVDELARIPTGKPVEIPRIQASQPGEDDAALQTRMTRREAVKEEFRHSWQGYREHAWLMDEVAPLDGSGKQTFGGWAATLVDALDTLWIMGLEDEFKEAVAACDKIDFTTSTSEEINVFETTIRYLGGFLAAYEISGKKHRLLLKKAQEVGNFLMGAFDTPNRLPMTRWNWTNYLSSTSQEAHSQTIVSEIGSLSLEFTKLSELTGDMRFYDGIQRISDQFEKSQDTTSLPGMWPIIVNAKDSNFGASSGYTLGGMSDSLYEYLPKLYLLLGGQLDQPKKLYEKFMKTAKAHVFWRAINPDNRQIVIAGDVHVDSGISYTYRGQHLTCFTGGMVGIASRIFERPEDLDIALGLAEGCVWSYKATPSGIGPEIFQFQPCGLAGEAPQNSSCEWNKQSWRDAVKEKWGNTVVDGKPVEFTEEQVDEVIKTRRLAEGFLEVPDSRYILRPEAIESVFIMYRITGDTSWMDKAWDMFTQINLHTRTDIAAAALSDVMVGKPTQVNSMESFWLAETLKYFYLVFSDFDTVSLDEWVLNTEAHPLKRMA